MVNYEYLPQLIVAYDNPSNNKIANLIHIKSANPRQDYYCPCCNGKVKPRAIESEKIQSHYYHFNEGCSYESQLHFLYKNWLFTPNSQFTVDGELFTVDKIEIEKQYITKFGYYKPDITVITTNGKTIYFEIFFKNRKTSTDYFCKWKELNNPVVEIDIKDYLSKSSFSEIPNFKYLYKNGECFSKTYREKDIYYMSIRKYMNELSRQDLLDYKSRIEKLDWFWSILQNPDEDSDIIDEITNAIQGMTYEDQMFCYDIIGKKQCMSDIRQHIVTVINNTIFDNYAKTQNLLSNEYIKIGIEHDTGRTYHVGYKIDISLSNSEYHKIYSHYKTVKFRKNIFSYEKLQDLDLSSINFDWANEKLNCLIEENELFKQASDVIFRENDDVYFVYKNNKIKSCNSDVELIHEEIKFLEWKDEFNVHKNEYAEIFVKFKNKYKKYKPSIDYEGVYNCEDDCYHTNFILNIYGNNFFEEVSSSFLEFIEHCEKKISNINTDFNSILDLVSQINNSKNHIWEASISGDKFDWYIRINQVAYSPLYYSTERIVYFDLSDSVEDVKNELTQEMNKILHDLEYSKHRLVVKA